MFRLVRRHRWRPLMISILIVFTLVGGIQETSAQPNVRGGPALRLVAPVGSVTIERPAGQPWLDIDLGTLMAAETSPFEIRVTRQSYDDPIVAKQIVRHGRTVRSITLDDDVVQNFGGFNDFFRLTLTNASGETVLDRKHDYCPGAEGETVRLRPSAPDTSAYPAHCSWNPFTLGSIWGIQAGWGASTGKFTEISIGGPQIPDGVYTARLDVTPLYRETFGISGGAATVQVTIQTHEHGSPALADRSTEAASAKPAKTRPSGRSRAPMNARPDLISLPAWSIATLGDQPGTPTVEEDLLTFAATIWNAGPSPLVIDGFRRPDEAVLDAYQYFYDSGGRQVGYAPTGEMEWDTREGHHHWHFTDFASYRLLNADQTEAVRSHKEAFCVAGTDAIDHFVRNAVWQPEHTDLETACDGHDAVYMRQVLEVGHGDTYGNYLPGQAFDISGLPNGTYYIQIVANPNGSLYETNERNNSALRKVILGGTPGARTVDVPPHGVVDG